VTARTIDRSRLRLGVVIAVVCGAIAFLVLQGLGNATSFYRNADEVVAKRADLGTKHFRLQGIVKPGTIKDAGNDVTFDVEYHCASVPVHLTGTRPPLFKDGIPVVLVGHFDDATGPFQSDQILIRHTAEYRTKASQQAEATQKEQCATSSAAAR
jgi:cytochrome c-type biogenesis protein CcmE